MRVWVALVTLSVVTALIACGSGSSSTDQQIPLAQCFPGWWLSLPIAMSPCSVCKAPNPPAECKFSDCGQFDTEGFRPSGAYFGGGGTYSAQAGTMSGFLTSTEKYTVTDGGFQIGNGIPITVTSCTKNQFLEGQVITTRAPANLAAAFDRVLGDGGDATFDAYPVTP